MRALLVHGLSSASGSWWFIRGELEADGWDVTTVDLRGHGDAAHPGTYRLADYASDLPHTAWDLAIGHSLGGAVVVLAAQDPAFAERLILLDPVLDVPEDQFDAILADQLDELSLTEERIAQLKPHWNERDRAEKLAGVRATDAFVVEHTFTDTGRWDVRTETTALTVPTLIIAGDPTVYSMLDPEDATAIVTANPLVELHTVPGTGHSPHRDDPYATIAAIRDWLLHH